MNELPNRERAARSRLTEAEVKEIVEAWRSGRLIDREAINYEAATVRAAMWWAKTGAGQLPVGAASDIVNAALGIGGR